MFYNIYCKDFPFILRYLIIFVVILSETDLSSYFWAIALFVYTKVWVLSIDLIRCKLAKSLMSSNNFLVEFSVFSFVKNLYTIRHHGISQHLQRGHLTSSSPIYILFFSLSAESDWNLSELYWIVIVREGMLVRF